MSLADRLIAAKAETGRRARNGCTTCRWLAASPPAVQAEVASWLELGLTKRELWEILSSDEDNPLEIGYSAFRNHLNDCMK